MVRTLKRSTRRHTRHTASAKKSKTRSRSKSKTRSRSKPISVVVHKTHAINHRATAKRRSPSKYYYDPEEGRYLGKIDVIIHGKSKSKSKSRRRHRV